MGDKRKQMRWQRVEILKRNLYTTACLSQGYVKCLAAPFITRNADFRGYSTAV